MVAFNKLFSFFLDKKGVEPRFKKTDYGYRTYDNTWKLFTKSNTITHTKPTKVYNGYEYEKRLEETLFLIVEKEKSVDVSLVGCQLI